MMTTRKTCLLLAVCVAPAFAALNARAEEHTKHPDAWITAKVKGFLALKKDVKGVGTNVETRNGVVTLRGTVDTLAEKELAERHTRSIEGVRGVNNRLVLHGDAEPERALTKLEGSGDRALSRIDDAALTGRVKTALAANRAVKALGTNVDTTDGKVTLTGTVGSEAEKSLAEQVAHGVKGVKSVDNRLVVSD